MAHEYLLKMIVNGLESLAADSETLFGYLNLRALVKGFPDVFDPAAFVVPEAPYPSADDSQSQAATLTETIADNTGLALKLLGGEPATTDPFDGGTGQADLLRLILDWGTLQAGVYKAIVQLYGLQPAPPARFASPGAASEQRLWAEIVAWLDKMAADTDLLATVQHFDAKPAAKKKGARSAPPSVTRMEQAVHRATLNTLQMAELLPYHLFHTAHPG
jgi:hypothetical protein